MFAALTLGLMLAPQRPNIILMLIDDMGWRDLGYAGSDLYETPNIDRISAAGARFTSAYSAHPVCSPSRAALMTGKNPVRVGITDWIPGDRPTDKPLIQPPINNELALKEVTIAEKLKKIGYRTFSIGKWHLGGDGFRPTDQGFDVNIGGSHIGQPGSYFFPYGPNVNPGLDQGKPGGYITDRLTDEAIRLIDDTKSQPFFLYFPEYAVHTPIQAKESDTASFIEKAKNAVIHKNAKYAAMIKSLDENVGRLIDHLEKTGRMKDTLFLFTSDNGGLAPVTNNAPLRSSKGFPYEGGIRVPAFAYWPGRIAPGTTISDRVITMDFHATVLQAAGSTEKAQDGISFMNGLTGKGFKQTKTFIWHYPQYHSSGQTPASAIREGDWKLVHHYENDQDELFNLAVDPNEKNDLSKSDPVRTKALWVKLKSSLDKMGARYPVKR